MTASTLTWLGHTCIGYALSDVEDLVRSMARCEDPRVSEVSSHIVRAGGKRLRPALALLAAEFGQPTARATRLAAGIELVHVSTLYFDDVMDKATTRRGLISVNSRWGDFNAALAGSYLLSRGTELVSSLGVEVAMTLARAVERAWTGQMRETEGAYNVDVDEAFYFEVITAKTGALFELACEAGAVVAQVTPDETSALARFGSNLGAAYQVVDDIMDIASDARDLGKPPGSDLRQGIYTLPVIDTLQGRSPGGAELQAHLNRAAFDPSAVDAAIRLLCSNGSLSRAMHVAGALSEEAKAALDRVPSRPARDTMLQIADVVVSRGGT